MNKKHSENADISTYVTFDMWCWPYGKVKNAEVIKYNFKFWQNCVISHFVKPYNKSYLSEIIYFQFKKATDLRSSLEIPSHKAYYFGLTLFRE